MTKKEELELAAKGEGPLGKSADDEPIFILCGRDPVAATVVRIWVILREALAWRGVVDRRERAKLDEARRHAERMDAWPKHPKFKEPT